MPGTVAPGEDPAPVQEVRENKRAPTATDIHIGAQIRQLRRGAGMTLKQLGKALGLSYVQVQRYETGASRLAASRLVAITEAFGVHLESLLGAAPANAETPGTHKRALEASELQRLFSGITEPRHRQAILALARAITGTTEVQAASTGNGFVPPPPFGFSLGAAE